MTSVPWRRPMTPRDPDEEHRVSTPLELFLDLCFVVAISASAGVLKHDLVIGHVGAGLLGFAIAFFAIWWAWVNYSWLASAYDSQDVRFRLLTFLVMVGVLVLAAGVPRGVGGDHDFRVMVGGYVVMRLALVPMWFLAARDDPPRRVTAHRYAWGVIVVQTLWVLRTAFFEHGVFGWSLLFALAIGELSIPWIAERQSGAYTPWHRHHIAERYGLFTIIVLGEVLLATTQAISESLDAHGLTSQLAQLIVGALLIVFSLWWFYFKSPMVDFLSTETAFVFGYAHYFVFGSIGAIGACLGAGVELLRTGGGDQRVVSLLTAAAITTFAISLSAVRWLSPQGESRLQAIASLLGLVVLAALPLPLGTAVLTYGVLLAASAALHVATHQPAAVAA